ncbi:FRG domain-containing protein [Streptococcus caviae]|uniref:FRG domain-containing protein n=1 Tax=Streptococcus sp. 'caviae' TaxID=1915004 RepID=UPI00094BA81A|nr:FRG domain-containing protein [Streptococcus sp. 'caviae']OLN83793.1 FRG domain-containing protein [Streptococcus sp. 'caviae']
MPENNFNIQKVNTITEFVSLINDSLQSDNKNYYYRGENEYFDYRTPSLYLEESLVYLGSEYYYRTLIKEMGDEVLLNNVELTRQLAERQHYGAKTRILDITTNPLVALFFAVDIDNDKDGYVYIYEEENQKEKFDSGHTIAIKTALNFIDQKVINNFLSYMDFAEKLDKQSKSFDISESQTTDDIISKFSNNMQFDLIRSCIDDGKKYSEGDDGLYYVVGEKNFGYYPEDIDCYKSLSQNEREHFNDILNSDYLSNFMELLNQRAMVKEKLIYPYKIYKDLKKAHIVFISKSTERIKQQQGAFIYPCFVNTMDKDFENIKSEINDSIKKKSNSLIIKIKSEMKKTIRKELRKFGITEGYIYPDIQHKSKDILEVLKDEYNK